MPNILIETREGWISSPAVIMNAVYSAIADVLKLPEWDRTVRLIEHPKSHFPLPPGRGEKFTLIEIMMFSGRSLDTKRALYKAIVDKLTSVGLPPADVTITLVETEPANWGIRGGQMASDIDLGFKVDI